MPCLHQERTLDHQHVSRSELVYRTPTHPRVANRLELLDLLPKNGVCAEVGVFRGDFACKILDRTSPRTLHLIDHWLPNEECRLEDATLSGDQAYAAVTERFASQVSAGTIVLHRKESLDALASFPDHYFDWVYLDASHFFHDVLAELLLCKDRVKPQGLILGHDYCEIFDHGVPRAVGYFCDEHEYDLAYLTDERPQPAYHRFGINASVPPRVAYNSFALTKVS